MCRFRFIFFTLIVLCSAACCAQSIDSLFARAPRAVLPLLDRTARLDLLDLYNHNLTSRAENTLGGQSVMLKKTADYLYVQTTDAGSWQMKLLPTGRDTLLCVVRSVKAGGTSSQVEMFNASWQRAKADVPSVSTRQFFRTHSGLSATREQMTQSVLGSLPIEALLCDTAATLTLRLSTDSLPADYQADAQSCAQPLIFLWNDGKWVLCKDENAP